MENSATIDDVDDVGVCVARRRMVYDAARPHDTTIRAGQRGHRCHDRRLRSMDWE